MLVLKVHRKQVQIHRSDYAEMIGLMKFVDVNVELPVDVDVELPVDADVKLRVEIGLILSVDDQSVETKLFEDYYESVVE